MTADPGHPEANAPAPAKTGRPSKYDPSFCGEVVQCLSEGHSVTAFAGRIGVARSTVFKWAEDHPEFSDALKTGQAKATEFWERILIKVARDGGGNATAAIFGVKNRASEDWADKTIAEHSGPDGGAIPLAVDDKDLARRIAFLLSKGISGSEAEK